MIITYYIISQISWRPCYGVDMCDCQWNWSLVFIVDITADRNSRININVYRVILSAQIQPNAVKLIKWGLTVQMMTKNILQNNLLLCLELLKAKKCVQSVT